MAAPTGPASKQPTRPQPAGSLQQASILELFWRLLVANRDLSSYFPIGENVEKPARLTRCARPPAIVEGWKLGTSIKRASKIYVLYAGTGKLLIIREAGRVRTVFSWRNCISLKLNTAMHLSVTHMRHSTDIQLVI